MGYVGMDEFVMRVDRVKELFIKLKNGFDWMESHPDNVAGIEALIERAKPILDELESLGVDRPYATALFFFGGIVNQQFLDQFRQDILNKCDEKEDEVAVEASQP